MGTHACGGQRMASSDPYFLGVSHCFLRQKSLTGLKLTNSTRLAGHKAQGLCLSLPPKGWDCKVPSPCLAFPRHRSILWIKFESFQMSWLIALKYLYLQLYSVLCGDVHVCLSIYTLQLVSLWQTNRTYMMLSDTVDTKIKIFSDLV